MSCRTPLAVAAACLVPVALVPAGAAVAQSDQFAIRAIGITKIDTSQAAINRLTVNCVKPGSNEFVSCVPTGKAEVRVGKATRKKLGLSSAVIAKGTIVARSGGEGEDAGYVDIKASKAVRKKLKKATSVKVTYRLAVKSPIAEVVKEKVTLTTEASRVERLLLRSSGDTFAISDRG